MGLSRRSINVIGGLEKAVCHIINPAKQKTKERLGVSFSNKSSSPVHKTNLPLDLGGGQHIFIYAKGHVGVASASDCL